ncbi:MAG: ADP-glyceromanno-heptose 6-epimerase, partial [Rhizobacter sp.]|nr:ADP-glyceromanno-heptose 6-epimerase [Chlorobiales bacterium]
MIALTGGAGFIGSAMLWTLNQSGQSDVLIADELGHTDKWKNLAPLRFADYFHKTDFLTGLLADKLPPLDAIIHLGANSSTTEPDTEHLMQNNFAYTKALANYCISKNIRFIYASSAATYGDGAHGYSDRDDTTPRLLPLNGYGYSKHLFDLWAMRQKAFDKITGLKFFNVFGPNEYHKGDMASVVFKAYHQIKTTGSVRLFKSHRTGFADGGQTRDFVYVKDCCSVMMWLLENPDVNGLFNLGTGHARTFKDLVSATFAAMNIQPNTQYIPMPDALQGKYQYFTEADMSKISEAGCPVEFQTLEQSVADYVQLHLSRESPYL